MGRLDDEEVRILNLLQVDAPSLELDLRNGLVIPRRLFEFGFIRRDKDGTLGLTKDGERRLFHIRCVDALRAIEAGSGDCVPDGVRQWLLNGGFIAEPSGEASMTITKRGSLWIASFEDDDIPVPAQDDAASYAMRRAQ